MAIILECQHCKRHGFSGRSVEWGGSCRVCGWAGDPGAKYRCPRCAIKGSVSDLEWGETCSECGWPDDVGGGEADIELSHEFEAVLASCPYPLYVDDCMGDCDEDKSAALYIAFSVLVEADDLQRRLNRLRRVIENSRNAVRFRNAQALIDELRGIGVSINRTRTAVNEIERDADLFLATFDSESASKKGDCYGLGF